MQNKLKRVVFWTMGIGIALFALSHLLGVPYIWKALIYQQVDYDDYKIFHNRPIEAGEVEAFPLHEKYGELQAPDSLLSFLTDSRSIGLLVLKDGKLLFEHYWEGYDEHTIANSFSVAKSYVSMLVGFAIQDGFISNEDQKIIDFLPELDPAVYGDIRIVDLLRMSSGLDWTESYSMPFNHTTEGYYGTDLKELVSHLERIERPGSLYKYKGCDTQLLALVLEAATGEHLADYLSAKFWIPVGAPANALWSLDHKGGIEKAYCCINTSPRGFAKIGQLYLNHGRWNGTQLLDSLWIARSVSPHGLPDKNGLPVMYYGYQWWCMADRGSDVFYCRGLNGQYVIVSPENNTVAVRIGHERRTAGNHPDDVTQILKWIQRL